MPNISNPFNLPLLAGPLFDLSGGNSIRSCRSSSYDRSGGNIDFRRVSPGQTLTILDVDGAGIVTHLWFALAGTDYNYLRQVVLRAYWDGETEPSVLCPLGDFFGVGHAITQRWQSQVMNMVRGDGKRGQGTGGNCYLPMPFQKGARIEVVNEGPATLTACYYMVDYLQMPASRLDGAGRFHACWHRANPVETIPPMSNSGVVLGRFGANTDGKANFVVCDIQGEGRFIGMNYSVDNTDPMPHGHLLNPFGEGDEMVFIDDEPWPPRLHGTGTEDYFLDAWGMTGHSNPYVGTSYMRDHREQRGRGTCYRFHIPDPVYFSKRLRFTFEHGHCNCQANDLAAVAYWYQHEPHAPLSLLPVEQRLPHPMEHEPDPDDERQAVALLDRLSRSFYDVFFYGDQQQVEDLENKPPKSPLRVWNDMRKEFQEGAVGVDEVRAAVEPMLDWFEQHYGSQALKRIQEQAAAECSVATV